MFSTIKQILTNLNIELISLYYFIHMKRFFSSFHDYFRQILWLSNYLYDHISTVILANPYPPLHNLFSVSKYFFFYYSTSIVKLSLLHKITVHQTGLFGYIPKSDLGNHPFFIIFLGNSSKNRRYLYRVYRPYRNTPVLPHSPVVVLKKTTLHNHLSADRVYHFHPDKPLRYNFRGIVFFKHFA